jgi:photosystem II stability/assembly factor-like uncharacterized protein
MHRYPVRILVVLTFLLNACGGSVPPLISDSATPPAPASPSATPALPTATPTSVPSSLPAVATDAPPPTPGPLASIVRERPTVIPAPDCLAATLPAPVNGEFVSSIAVAGGGHILVSTYTSVLSRSNIYLSEDAGLTWSLVRSLNDYISTIVSSPAYARDHTVFAGGSGGVYRSFNGGAGWSSITPGTWVTTTPIVRQLALSPNYASDHTILFGSRTSPRGVFASTDSGATWTDWLVDAIDVALFSPNYALDRAVWVARNDDRTFRRDVLITTNQGDAWEFVRSGTALPYAVSPAYAQDSTIVWTDVSGGLYLSRNSDRMFPLIEKADADVLKIWQNSPQFGWLATGEEAARDLVFSPDFAQDRTAYALAGAALVISRDGGASWQPVCFWPSPLKPEGAPVFAHLAISPTFGADRTLYAGGSGGRIAVSHDGGQTWSIVSLR